MHFAVVIWTVSNYSSLLCHRINVIVLIAVVPRSPSYNYISEIFEAVRKL
jgi:hypothetical protein